MRLELAAPVTNNWTEFNATLVNKVTGEEFSLEKGVEYYTGYEDGSSWSEGSRKETAFFTALPRGAYMVQIEARRGPGSNIAHAYIDMTYDVINHRNLSFSMLMVLIFSLIQYQRINMSEKRRWSNSPYTPYQS